MDEYGVPILRYGPKNNFLKFKDKLRTACMKQYGDLGRLIELNDYYKPKEVDKSEYPAWESDALERELMLDEMQRRRKLIAKMKENHTCMYAYCTEGYPPKARTKSNTMPITQESMMRLTC